MKSVTIKLDLAEYVKKFVSIAEKYPFEIDLRSGRHVVNAKSMLGIFSLDLSEDVVLEIFSDDCAKFLDEINEFVC
ncbi:MAG TPA: HPr family phosphocarrier protein [Clostridia bacterium]|nr:HPr family phosphocarrier protein [Clostridia bacterium]